MSERKYYCLCDSNCKFETMTKEQILAAIAQAAETGLVFDTEAAFITKVKESNAGGFVTFWVGTKAQYNALARKEPNCQYIITDDTTLDDIAKLIKDLQDSIPPVDSTLTAAGAAADAKAVGERWYKDCNNTDMNTVKTAGFYYGYTGMTNAADTNHISVWEVIAYSSDWGLQRQTVINGDGTSTTYERNWYSGSYWGAWGVKGGSSGGGLTREFSTVPSESEKYTFTTKGVLAKFYIVTTQGSFNMATTTIDWSSLAVGSPMQYVVPGMSSNGSVEHYLLTATRNANSTVTFSTENNNISATIEHVVGYY